MAPYFMLSAMTSASPFRRSRDDKRRDLTRHCLAAIEPLLANGERYADVSVVRIIQASGIARSTFYEYFEDKGDLLSAMADDVLDELLAQGHYWWNLPDTAGKADLRAALLPAIAVNQRHATTLAAIAEGAAYDDRMHDRQARLINEVVADLTGHIRRAQLAGSACPHLDPEPTAQWLTWMQERGLHQLVLQADPTATDTLVDALTDVIWRTLYAGYRSE